MEHGIQPCPICSKQIQTGHNLSEHNLRAHIEACPRQQSRRYQQAQKRASKRAIRSGVGSVTVAAHGQLGFPFDGIPAEVTA